jgi:hypothetical protein
MDNQEAINALLQDVIDDEERSRLESVINAAMAHPVIEASSMTRENVKDVLTVVGYFDLRKQIKACQREIADSRKKQDQLGKQLTAMDEKLTRIERASEALVVPGREGDSRSMVKRQQELRRQEEEGWKLVQGIAKKLGVG